MKSLKNLFIPSIIVLLLFVALIIYYVVFEKDDNDAAISTETSIDTALLRVSPDLVKSINVDIRNGVDFTVFSSLSGTDQQEWYYSSKDGDVSSYRISQQKLISFVENVTNINSVRTIRSGEEYFSEYGLYEPQITVVIYFADGEMFSIYLGDLSVDGEYVYGRVNESQEVYLVTADKYSICDSTLIDFLDLNPNPFDIDDVDSVSFTREKDQVQIIASPVLKGTDIASNYPDAKWIISSPVLFPASAKFDSIADKLLLLPISEYVGLDSVDLSIYGLENPEYSADIVLKDGASVKIWISELVGYYYYGRSDSFSGIFKMESSNLVGLQFPLSELVYPFLTGVEMTSVHSVDVSFPEGGFYLDIDVEEGVSLSSVPAEIYIDKRNAKVTDQYGKYYFSALYDSITDIRIDAIDIDANPKNTKDISIEIFLREPKIIRIDLSIRDDTSYYAFYDGEYTGFLINKEEFYYDGKTVIADYGIWDAYTLLGEALDGAVNGTYDISVP